MRVSRLGNSLMVRVPASVVAALHLMEGDEVEILGTAQKQLYMFREPAPRERQEDWLGAPTRTSPRTSTRRKT